MIFNEYDRNEIPEVLTSLGEGEEIQFIFGRRTERGSTVIDNTVRTAVVESVKGNMVSFQNPVLGVVGMPFNNYWKCEVGRQLFINGRSCF
jgi:hypothetical protein